MHQIMANSIVIQTQDFLLQNGQLVSGNQLLTQIRSLLLTPLGSYKHNSKIGSNLVSYLKGLNTLSQTQLRSIISNSLQPLVQSKSITNLQVLITINPSGDIGIIINCIDNNGNPVTFEWEYTGDFE